MDQQELVPSSESAPVVFDASLLAGQLAPSSIAMYRRDAAAYLAFAGEPALALRPETLARWRTHLAQETECSPNTINRMLSAIKRLVREAANQGYVNFETSEAMTRVAGVKQSALKQRMKSHRRTRISPEQMRALCAAPDQATLIGMRDAALLNTLASSGLRVAEVARLTERQIEPAEGGVLLRIQGKGDAEPRQAPLSRNAHALIKRWLAERHVASDYIFTAFDGRGEPRLTARHLSAPAIWQIVQGYAIAVGVPHVKPHDFRRFVGTQLASRDIRKAQKALGHKRIDTTARHYVLDDLEAGLTDDLY